MKIEERTDSRMVVTRGCLFDRLFFALLIAGGVVMLFIGLGPDAQAWLLTILGLLFVGAGAYFLILTSHMTLTLDRAAGVARIDWTKMRAHESRTVRLEEVRGLSVEDNGDSDRLALTLADGSTVPLVRYSYTGGDHPKVKRAVDEWLAKRS